ncbi:MAG: esterase/lipase family protein [Myxococcales bacterium]
MRNAVEASLAILNGYLGDYLARTGNGLATEMTFVTKVRGGSRVRLERLSLERAYPAASPRVAVLLHGLMCTESIWEMRDGSDYGALLARDLGMTPIYARYNTGLPVAENGANLCRALDALVADYPLPIEEVIPIGHSMGGLVIRSAAHVASLQRSRWLPLVRRAIYVGTPHLGAPLERVGRAVTKLLRALPDPYTRLIADIGDLRSAGIKDLGDGLRDPRHPIPLLPGIRHYLIAGSLSDDPRIAALFGDALVPVPSATDGHVDPRRELIPPGHVRLMTGLGHLTLAHHDDLYPSIRSWCEEMPS